MSERPVCPLCQQGMVPMRWAAADGSGYTFGWACHCTLAMRLRMSWDEVIVESAMTTLRIGGWEVYLSQVETGESG